MDCYFDAIELIYEIILLLVLHLTTKMHKVDVFK